MKQLAIEGTYKTKTKPFHRWPYSDDREKELLNRVIASGNWWRMTGEMVKTFESNFAALHECKYCLGVTNGTHAIELALTSLGIGCGDEVIIPAVTFISTGTAVLYCNASPVLVDIDPDTYCIDPDKIEQAITPNTKAIIPVHMAGHACDMEAIMKIAKNHNLYVIEDAAHGHGGKCMDKSIGSYGDCAIFSFQNGKIMTCGEGGAFTTNNQELYEKAYLIHGVGRPYGDRVYEHRILGSNYRMNEFQAAILIAQQERLTQMNATREKNALYLDSLLKDIDGITPQGRKTYATLMTHYMYMFYYDAEHFNRLSREKMVDHLIAEGIPAFVCFPVISDVSFFQKKEFSNRINAESLPAPQCLENAQNIANNVIWIPHYALLGDEQDIDEIAQAIKKIQTESQNKRE